MITQVNNTTDLAFKLMMKSRVLTTCMVVFYSVTLSQSRAQDTSPVRTAVSEPATTLQVLEDELAVLQYSIAERPTDAERMAESVKIASVLEQAFEQEGIFDYPFSKLQKIATLKSPDGAFRIFNWNVPHTDATFSYYLYIVVPKKNSVQVYQFYDTSSLEAVNETQAIDPQNWYGAIYYSIQMARRGGDERYLLLGWDGKDRSSTCKVIETLALKGGKPKMGIPVLETAQQNYVARRIFEYSDQSIMTLEYLPEMDAIVFNDLVPIRGDLQGQYQFYGPGVSMHAYQEEKGVWKLQQNVPMKRPKEMENKEFRTPQGVQINQQRSGINPLTGKGRK